MHFGMRSRLEHTALRWGDVELKQTSTREEYLEFNERATRTRTGVTSDSRSFPPKMFADPGNPRCPVAVYKMYASKRPERSLDAQAPFYLGTSKTHSDSWFVNQAMGKNTIGSLIKSASTEGNLAGRKVNHSARKTAITTLVHKDLPPTRIMQLSGHKNVNSINNYSSASFEQQREMSTIITKLNDGNTRQETVSVSTSEVRSSQEQVATILRDIEMYENHMNLPEADNVVATRQQSPHTSKAVSTTSKENVSGIPRFQNVLAGATVHGNIVFNIEHIEPPRKFRRLIIDSGSD